MILPPLQRNKCSYSINETSRAISHKKYCWYLLHRKLHSPTFGKSNYFLFWLRLQFGLLTLNYSTYIKFQHIGQILMNCGIIRTINLDCRWFLKKAINFWNPLCTYFNATEEVIDSNDTWNIQDKRPVTICVRESAIITLIGKLLR